MTDADLTYLMILCTPPTILIAAAIWTGLQKVCAALSLKGPNNE